MYWFRVFLFSSLIFECLDLVSQTIDFRSDTVCFGEPTRLTAITSFKNHEIKAYKWDLDFDGYFDDANGSSVLYRFPDAGTFQVTLMVISEDDNEHVMDSFKHVIVIPLPEGVISIDNNCERKLSKLNIELANNNIQLEKLGWAINNIPVNNCSNSQVCDYNFIKYGEYLIKTQLVSNFGCSYNITDTIIIHESPIADLSHSETICLNDSLLLINKTRLKTDILQTCVWKFGDGNQKFTNLEYLTHTYDTNGKFDISLIAITNHQCNDTATSSVEIYSPEGIELTYQDDSVIYSGKEIVITANEGFSEYKWSTGEISEGIKISDPGYYSLEAIDENGCLSSKTIRIEAFEKDNHIKLIAENNIITPNGDGLNDYLIFNGIDGYSNYTLTIFNRWGDEIVRIDNYKNNWNGTKNGKPLETGTYFYFIKANDIKLSGSVNILKQ